MAAMPYYEFLWTGDIVRHLADHGISQDDFEHVVCNPLGGKCYNEVPRGLAGS